jgi:hypothetical protein
MHKSRETFGRNLYLSFVGNLTVLHQIQRFLESNETQRTKVEAYVD